MVLLQQSISLTGKPNAPQGKVSQSGFAIEKLLAPEIFVMAALENEIPRTHSKLLTPFLYWRQLR
jgi:hypothetical protein